MKNKNVLTKLSLKYMTMLALITVFICTIFCCILFLYAKNIRKTSLIASINQITETINDYGTDELDFIQLPYFIDCTVYEKHTNKTLWTNNRAMPLLSVKPNKYTEYHEKNFYSDSDLKVSLLIGEANYEDKSVIVQCSMDIENDSLAKIVKGFPKVLMACFFPILAVSFLISYFISFKTIEQFKKLESAFEKEKAFSSNVSHELKTPLQIIDGHANLIKRWGMTNEEQLKKSISVIIEESQNMTAIIQTLLELSKIEANALAINKSGFYLSNLFARLRDEFISIYPDLKIHIKDDDAILIKTDENILHQILTAIASNSVKFAGKDCTITFETVKKGSSVKIKVIDSGTGFKNESLPYVFERFYKGDKSHSRNGSGSGLGLAIAKALCETLNGRISAYNSPKGGAVVELLINTSSNA